MEILNYEGLLKYNEALHEDLLTNYASVLDINAVELDIEALKTNKVSVSDMMTPDSANGHAYVDLGLPSGTLWATMNVGASSETDYGNYYQYGKGAEQYAATSGQSDYNGTEDPLDSSVDTASQVWGGSWHMPTKAQMEELTANTTYQWTTINGVNGGKFTATNGNYVFFPAAGVWDNYGSQRDVGYGGSYWSSSPNGGIIAFSLYFYDGDEGMNNSYRKCGFSVRGVIDGPITPGSPKYATKEELNTVAGTKQDVIDSSHKLSADLITDGTTNKVINVKPDWNAASGSDAEILNKPTNVSSFTNDAKYVTEDDMQVVEGANGHEYVEIGGIKWATMNIGANSITDTGLYFQWGDTQGYTAAQVGSGEGQKYFGWADYKYGNGTSSPGDTGMTKYNETDGKTVLEAVDDAAVANWGGSWRMPTTAEFQALRAAVNTELTYDYQGSGIAGLVCTDKTDSSKTLFFPAAGNCDNGSVEYVDNSGLYWSSSLYTDGYIGDRQRAYSLAFLLSEDYGNWGSHYYRRCGYAVRPVLDASKGPKYATKAELADVATSGSYNDLSDKPTIGAFVIETTYAELVAAKNGGTLAKGAWYRITDYVTTTAQSNTQSAGHAFDVIVRADSESVLNENAFAIQHEGDTYFANQKLSAWELKYDINNDTTKYAWADATNGKGVIYYMKDENDNECPYDFKNIQFKVGAKEQAGTVTDVFYYTFSVATGTNDATVTDHSLNGGYCYGNKMGLYISSNKRQLSNNVFRNTSATSECRYNTFGNNCNSNVFGSCGSNKFGNSCSNNTFGNYCYGNTFGNGCSNNTFRDSCNNNTFGNGCTNNKFGNSCSNNKFGYDCNSNTFGNTCSNNTFGNDCNSNTFGNTCSNNTFGNGCNSNTFGNGCGGNTFGNSSSGNTFGNGCGGNTFGNSCSNNKFGTASTAKDCYKNIIFENSVQYVLLDCTQTTSSSAYCQNVLVGMGIKGTSSSKKTLTVATANNAFKTVFKTANDIEIDA